MYRVCRPLAVAACAFWLNALAFGQPPGLPSPPTPFSRPFSNPYGRSLEWLANPQVQEELQLTNDQWDKIKQAQDEMRKKVRELYRSGEFDPRDPQKRQQADQKLKALSDEAESKARAILTPAQAERLQQMIRQTQMDWGSLGIIGVLLDKDVGEKLGLTEQQRDDLRRTQAQVFEENNRKLDEFRRQLRADTREKMFSLLTDEQRKTLEGLLGPRFELKSPVKSLPAGQATADQPKPKT